METVKRKAYAKINLGLDVIGRRPNGYHDVRMIMQTVDLWDELTFQRQKEFDGEQIEIQTNHAELTSQKDNLIYKAAQLMINTYHITEGIAIRLEKNIPIAAGMAGGSTDAAATFMGINELFELGATGEELRKLGVTIGADIPYCIMGGTVLAEGIGEKLTQLPPAPDCCLVVAKPDIHVSTKMVYEKLDAAEIQSHPDIDGMVQAVEAGDLPGITDRLGNVLETVTAELYPIIQQIKTLLQENGAQGVLMSGSGPTVFALYPDKNKAEKGMEALRKTGMAKQLYVTALTKGNGMQD